MTVMVTMKMMVVRMVVVRKRMEKNEEEKDSSRKPSQETCAGQPSSGFPPLEPTAGHFQQWKRCTNGSQLLEIHLPKIAFHPFCSNSVLFMT